MVNGKNGRVRVIVVAGPTASGKSDLAIALTRRFDGEVISADSRQVYWGMDVGTGKVSRDKMTNDKLLMTNNVRHSSLDIRNWYFSGGVRHWLLDVASPLRQYSAARWRRYAEKAVRDITRRGKIPIICGGTGFYIDGLVYGTGFPEVRPDAALRARLEKKTTAQLFSWLKRRDARRAANIDPHNRRRLVRALEIVFATGRPVPPPRREHPYDVLYLAVAKPFHELKRRIERRLDARLKTGMVAEVRHLHENGVSYRRMENFGLEYRWVARYLQKKISRGEMRDGLLHDIIAYAKRQMTWWRKNKDVRWIKNRKETEGLVRRFLKNGYSDPSGAATRIPKETAIT